MSQDDHSRYPLLVLIVDDSADMAESEVELLATQGHMVRVALDGESALQCVAEECPDVVLLDIRMPRLDGFAVAQLIRARCAGGKQPIIVAVTGCGYEIDHWRFAEAGFDLRLVKPVDPALLIGVLEGFRRLLAPPTTPTDLDPTPEDPPDGRAGRLCLAARSTPVC